MARKVATTTHEYAFSYSVESYTTRIDEEPLAASDLAEPTVPVGIFAHASTLQALVRYLRDTRGLSTGKIATLLGRTPQCIAATRKASPTLPHVDEDGLRIPVRTFRSPYPPLEALVKHLRERGLRNAEVARLLALDPRTTWTSYARAKARRVEVAA